MREHETVGMDKVRKGYSRNGNGRRGGNHPSYKPVMEPVRSAHMRGITWRAPRQSESFASRQGSYARTIIPISAIAAGATGITALILLIRGVMGS